MAQPDGGDAFDGGGRDSAVLDAPQGAFDASSLPDAGTRDAGRRDAGRRDARVADARVPDVPRNDAGSDAGRDAGSDAGRDAGSDAGRDAGNDAGPTSIEDPTRSSDFPLADPDTVLALDGSYISYGTTVPAGAGPRCGGVGELFVPYLVHGSGNSVRISDCAAGDAMPDGPGAWAQPGGAIWAPGVARFGSLYYMYYTASRRGSGQKCIGRATSATARGPFISQGEFSCPRGGRWAIDANPFVDAGSLYVSFRDDAITTLPETGLSVVRTDAQGRAIWSTRRDLLRSTDVDWDETRISGSARVVENPSVFRHDGTWYVAYSGNNWDSPRYATGVADCGASPLPASVCTPLRNGVVRPYFGFTGAAGLGPYRGLPGNHEGPGGIDIFAAADGTLRAIWHWWSAADRSRHSVVGRFVWESGGFRVVP